MVCKTKGVIVTSKKPFTLRLDDALRDRAERVARAENRTLTSLVTHALARAVEAFESRTSEPAATETRLTARAPRDRAARKP